LGTLPRRCQAAQAALNIILSACIKCSRCGKLHDRVTKRLFTINDHVTTRLSTIYDHGITRLSTIYDHGTTKLSADDHETICSVQECKGQTTVAAGSSRHHNHHIEPVDHCCLSSSLPLCLSGRLDQAINSTHLLAIQTISPSLLFSHLLQFLFSFSLFPTPVRGVMNV
jgi:hypothetical protein